MQYQNKDYYFNYLNCLVFSKLQSYPEHRFYKVCYLLVNPEN